MTPYFQVPRFEGVATAYQIQLLILLTELPERRSQSCSSTSRPGHRAAGKQKENAKSFAWRRLHENLVGNCPEVVPKFAYHYSVVRSCRYADSNVSVCRWRPECWHKQ